MPRSLASGNSPTQELRHFINREQERNVLKRILALPPGDALPVVMFYGVGGTGKSWLLRRLRADLPPEIPSALLDFDPQSGGAPYHTDYSRALSELRRQLASVECPRFDLAYSWLRFHEGVKDEPLLKDKELAAIATEALAELAAAATTGLPLVGFFTNLGKAINCYAAALNVLTETDFPAEWATVQHNLGDAYANLSAGNLAECLEDAIACYQDALRVRTEADFPAAWAETQGKRGEALENLSALTKEKSVLLSAIACFEAAIRGYTVCGLSDEAAAMRKRADERK